MTYIEASGVLFKEDKLSREELRCRRLRDVSNYYYF